VWYSWHPLYGVDAGDEQTRVRGIVGVLGDPALGIAVQWLLDLDQAAVVVIDVDRGVAACAETGRNRGPGGDVGRTITMGRPNGGFTAREIVFS
jgi:hypothetical protein